MKDYKLKYGVVVKTPMYPIDIFLVRLWHVYIMLTENSKNVFPKNKNTYDMITVKSDKNGNITLVANTKIV